MLLGGQLDQPSDLAAWTVTGPEDAARIGSTARTGSGALEVSWDQAADVRVSQVFHGVAPGAYTVRAYVRTPGVDGASLALGDDTWRRTGFPQEQTEWLPVVVRGVPSSTGQLEVAFDLSGTPGQSVLIDDVTLLPDQEATDFFRGGDLNYVHQIEDAGGRYFDADGDQVDPIQYMADQGVNLARLRLYNDTGPEHHQIGHPEYYLADGYQDPEDVLRLAQRAHDAGMQIQLTFHYSDYWTNGELQNLPVEWRDEITALDPLWVEATDPKGLEHGSWDPDGPGAAAAADRLEDLVHDYTADFLERMNAQGTPPAFVALGNETAGGLLLPWGRSWQFDGGNWPDLARFYNAGSSAVRETTPGAQVIIHLDAAGDDGKYTWYHDELVSRGVDYDVIGASYYPFWTKKDPATIAGFLERMHDRYGKPVMVMETAVNWSPVTHDDVPGQLTDNGGIQYDQTKAGQLNFTRELFARFKALEPGVVLGDIWWDPVMIPADGVGWVVGEPNVVSNSAMFDFDGRALPVFRAFQENSSAPRQPVAAAAAPAVPAPPTLTVQGRAVTVRWTPPEDGGAPITAYRVTLTSQSGSTRTADVPAPTTTATFTGLAAGRYTATITATNAVGTSAPSVASAPVRVVAAAPGVGSETVAAVGTGEITTAAAPLARDAALARTGVFGGSTLVLALALLGTGAVAVVASRLRSSRLS
ncbi:glycosyl hydrolase 53 family protein [Cellulomonas endometrii]|uniref:glycosyl hydrolase 53 family protein n=1 Tax=Cellulomonas endometrii TaxID=3036301 RepID=UPI0024ADDBFB|nr:glycosyl hydrolase 53 family protein [Cellulomonas endometrii]